MSTWEADLLVGLAVLLDAETSGVWKPAGGYQTSETAIVVDYVPVSPDRIVCLSLYELPGGDGIGDVLYGLQVRTRGTKAPLLVRGIAGECRDFLDGLGPGVINGVAYSQIRHQSSTGLGPDGNGRFERTDNYYIDARRETTHRHD